MTPQEVQKQWIERLRSGRIPQTRAVLGYPNGRRCCLGVLCDIAVEQGVIPLPMLDEYGSRVNSDGIPYATRLRYGTKVDNSVTRLPEAVRKWAGLHDQSGVAYRPDDILARGDSLVKLNDEGASFTDIANELEKHPTDYLEVTD